MDFKKCDCCGCFYTSNDTVCPKCAPKELFELSKLKEFFEDHDTVDSIDTICVQTGINPKNINRYLSYKDFSSYLDKLDSTGSDGNISIGL